MAFMMSDRDEMLVEGVTYYRHVVCFTLVDGRRRRWIRWFNLVDSKLACIMRELGDRVGLDNIQDGSLSYRAR